MKKSNLNWMLAAFATLAFLVIATSAVKSSNKTKPRLDPTMYYWYDASGNYKGYQATIDDEMALTGWNEGPSGTVRERGYAPANVTPTPYPPTPIGSADKILFSQP